MPSKSITWVLDHGCWKIPCTKIGNKCQTHSCGFMVYVSNYQLEPCQSLLLCQSWFRENNPFVSKANLTGNKLLISCSSTVVQDIQLTAKQGSIGLAYFYCEVSDIRKQNVPDILRSLILNLLFWQPSNQLLLDNIYEDCMQGLVMPSNDKLLEALKQLICGFDMTYILIDALDECSHWEEILEFIETLHKWDLRQCHLLVTSRKEQQIIESMMAMGPMEVDMSQMSVDNDIERYLDSMLHSSEGLKELGQEEKHLIKQVLLEKAKGM